MLPEIKRIDNIVHNGAAKHEASIPERNFAETLRIFETEIMNRIADGLTRFARVVVTADHETGGLTLVDGDLSTGKITGRYSTSGHTGLMVPVFAYGPGAEVFGGIDENTSFFNKFISLLKLKQ